MSTGSVQMQLESQIRRYIGKYYEGWTSCDDPTCDYRTRMMGVYGRRCLRQGCRGAVSFEVGLHLPGGDVGIELPTSSILTSSFIISWGTLLSSSTANEQSNPPKEAQITVRMECCYSGADIWYTLLFRCACRSREFQRRVFASFDRLCREISWPVRSKMGRYE